MSDVDSTALTSRLEAFNRVRSRLGEDPVSSLPVANDQAAARLETVLDEQTKQVLLMGFDFNTEYNVEVTAAAGQLSLPAGALYMDSMEAADDWVQRGNVMFNRGTLSSTDFSGTYKCKVVRGLTLAECPEHVRNYIISRTALAYIQRFDAETELLQILAQDELQTRQEMMRFELDTRDTGRSYMNNPALWVAARWRRQNTLPFYYS